MTVMVVAHPIPGFSGYVRVEDVGLPFIGGFTGPIDVPSYVQTQLADEGYTLNATPLTDYGPQYVTNEDLEDPGSDASVTLRAASVAVVEAETVQKRLKGGIFPQLQRAPHLNVEATYPSAIRGVNLRVMWAEGDLIYAIGGDRGLYKSTNRGLTWADPKPMGFSGGSSGAFLRLPSGTLLTVKASSPQEIMRSADDGVTWTSVHTLRNVGNIQPNLLGAQSWDYDSAGVVYYGEYDGTDYPDNIHIYRATDDGLTWGVFHEQPGIPGGTADRMRHLHSVQFDAVSNRVYFLFGDSEPQTGIYRTNAAGALATGIEPVITNTQAQALDGKSDNARAIGLMFFPTHIAWATDQPGNGKVLRMPRADIGVGSPRLEKVCDINSSGYFTCPASADRTRWLFTSSSEAGANTIDTSSHLYVAEDNGATVYEIGSLPQHTVTQAALAPIGRPELHGDEFWLQSHGFKRSDGGSRRFQIRGRLSYGGPPILGGLEPAAPLVRGWQSVSSGRLTPDAANAGFAFGATRVAESNRFLVILNGGFRRLVGASSAKLQIYDVNADTVLWETAAYSSAPNLRQQLGKDSAPYLVAFDIPVGHYNTYEFRIVASGIPWTGVADITYAWTNNPATVTA